MARLCPGCGSEMIQETVGGLDLAVCPVNGCVWYKCQELADARHEGSKEFDDIIATLPPNEPPDESTPSGPCPDCHLKLRTFPFAALDGVTVSQCDQCSGVYMSRGNLLHMDAHMKRLEARQVPGVTRPLNAEESAAVNSMNAQLASEQAIDAKWIHMFWHFTPKFMRTNPFQIPGV